MKIIKPTYNADTDLILERDIPVTAEQAFEAWTNMDLIKQWFVPKPWTIAHVNIDYTPGGNSEVTMKSPEGDEFPNPGCVLHVVPNQQIVFTDCLRGDFRPAPENFFTAVLTLTPNANGCHYHVLAMHKDAESKKKHEEMGFHDGWGKCLDQLVELMSSKGASA